VAILTKTSLYTRHTDVMKTHSPSLAFRVYLREYIMYSSLVPKWTKYYCSPTDYLYDLLFVQRVRDWTFLERYWWTFRPSGVLHCLVQRVVTDVSKVRNAFIFGIQVIKELEDFLRIKLA